MPNGVRIDARRDFVRRVLPWLIAAAMLLFYGLTVNHWVSLTNLSGVATISGWTWSPHYNDPLFYLVTMPFRLLPAAALPLALNLFSALCAALTLGLLARSVGLLPHDRTEAQQVRERNDFFLLTLRSAWLPPLLAALLCGLQLTFWGMATNGGPETFDLLLFALVIWSLVEYRLDGRVWRLYSSAAVVGAGIIEGPAITAFFPLFIVAIVWVRGLAFFNIRFLLRIFLYGLAGLLLILLYQLASVSLSNFPLTFWQAAKFSLGPHLDVLKIYWACISNPGQYFSDLLMPIFISLMPLLVMSVRWKFGDSSKIGSWLASLMFHTIHAVFLGVCLWIAFDPPFSPREKNLGLPLYYLIALSAGYYAGYFLLIFGKRHPRAKDTPLVWVIVWNRAVVVSIWAAAVLALAGLVCKNAPLIRGFNSDILQKFASLLVKNLPSKGAIVLSDDIERMYLAKAAVVSDGKAKDFLFVDTAWLPYPDYHRFLHKVSPEKWPLLVKPEQTNALSPLGLIELLALLNRTNELYYLHPSFGYYFEEFYPEPHGLVYKLRPLPRDTLVPPPPGKDLTTENDEFWKTAQMGALTPVERAVAPDAGGPPTFAQAQLERLHIPSEPNINALVVGAYCSRSLDFWAVELQRLGDLTDAAADFREALQLNPDNSAAKLNLQVNDDLASRRPMHADPAIAADRLGNFRNLADAIANDGPIDDPAFCFQYGFALAQDNKFYRQAVAPLKRACDLDPDFLPARIWLARVYGLNRMPDRMMSVLRSPIVLSDEFSPAANEINMLLSAAYFQKNDLAKGSRILEMEVSHDPTNQALLTTVGQIYLNRGMFSNALAIANMQLRLSPDNSSWLLTKGYIYNQLKQYDEAIATLNHVLTIEKENTTAVYQIANAYFGAGNLEAARTNYETLQLQHTNSPQLALGLGEIAWRQRNTNEAIRNIEIYLSHAPTNTSQAQLMAGRLRQLQQASADK